MRFPDFPKDIQKAIGRSFSSDKDLNRLSSHEMIDLLLRVQFIKYPWASNRCVKEAVFKSFIAEFRLFIPLSWPETLRFIRTTNAFGHGGLSWEEIPNDIKEIINQSLIKTLQSKLLQPRSLEHLLRR